jgi:hypothetical protein
MRISWKLIALWSIAAVVGYVAVVYGLVDLFFNLLAL